MKFDIKVGFKTNGVELFASETFTVESDTKENAIEIAKSKVSNDVISISVCERG